MEMQLKLSEIDIRTELLPGDIGFITYLHGQVYAREYQYGISFESYVADGLSEFYRNYDPNMDQIWVCEHKKEIMGSLFLMNRNTSAQLRYFLIHPDYRGMGLGKKLMEEYMVSLKSKGYTSSYLWTTHELKAAASLYTCHGFTLSREILSSDFGKEVYQQRYDLSLLEENG